MSGFEVAGVVLGAIPILIATLQLGQKASSRTTLLFKHRQYAQKYNTALDAERAFFQNTLQLLLADIVTPLYLKKLLDNPGGNAWHDDAFKARLRDQCLREDYAVVISHMESMKAALSEFGEKIGQNETSNSRLKLASRIVLHQPRLDELIEIIQKKNDRLSALSKQAKLLFPIRATGTFLAGIESLQAKALSLYRAVKGALSCSCAKHNAAIVIDPVDWRGPMVMLLSMDDVNNVVKSPWLSIDAHLVDEPVETTTPLQVTQPATKKRVSFRNARANTSSTANTLVPLSKVTNFCKELGRSYRSGSLENFGFVEDDRRAFNIALCQPTPCPHPDTVASLQQVLSDPKAIMLELSDKMRLAADMARAIFMLYGTPWLPRGLDRDHVLFFLSAPARLCISAALHPVQGALTCASLDNDVRHPMLYYLGVFLVELLYDKKIHRLAAEAKFSPDSGDPEWKQAAEIAHRLLERGYIRGKSSWEYEDAVRACFQTELDRTVLRPVTGFEANIFWQHVYQTIVEPLASNITS